MPWELENIGYNDRLPFFPCLATYSMPFLYGVAGDITLERSQFKPFSFDDIEPSPEVKEKRRVEKCRHVGQRPNMVVYVLNQRFYLRTELLVSRSFLLFEYLLLGKLLFMYLTLAILTDMLRMPFATELLVWSEPTTDFAVPSMFVFLLHSHSFTIVILPPRAV